MFCSVKHKPAAPTSKHAMSALNNDRMRELKGMLQRQDETIYPLIGQMQKVLGPMTQNNECDPK